VFCQVCGKEGHPTWRCYNRYDESYNGAPPQKKYASAANTSYGVDTNWYMDTGGNRSYHWGA
jgi:hypothetical protein